MIASRLRREAILYEPGRDITIFIGEGVAANLSRVGILCILVS